MLPRQPPDLISPSHRSPRMLTPCSSDLTVSVPAGDLHSMQSRSSCCRKSPSDWLGLTNSAQTPCGLSSWKSWEMSSLHGFLQLSWHESNAAPGQPMDCRANNSSDACSG